VEACLPTALENAWSSTVRPMACVGRVENSALRVPRIPPAHTRELALAHRGHTEGRAGAIAARRSPRHARDRRNAVERVAELLRPMRLNRRVKASTFSEIAGAGDGNRIASLIHKSCDLAALPPTPGSNGAKWRQFEMTTWGEGGVQQHRPRHWSGSLPPKREHHALLVVSAIKRCTVRPCSMR
jgi:hypothetical protein